MTRSRARCAWIAGLALVSGCFSSSYHPQPGQLALVTRDNRLTLVSKEGRETRFGLAGGGLVDVVASVPDAHRAETFRRRRIGALLLGPASSVCVVGVVAYRQESRAREGGEYELPAPLSITMSACAVGLLVAALLEASARPHALDAVHLFNASDTSAHGLAGPPQRFPPGRRHASGR